MAKKIGIIVLLCFSLCVGGVSAFANEGHDETDTQTLIETQPPVSSVLFRQDGADIQQSTDEGKTWQSYHPETGKRIIKNVLGKTQAECKAKLKKAIEESQALDISRADEYTVAAWLRTWFELYAKPHIRPSTMNYYHRNIEQHIIPAIGDIPLNKLTTRDLQKLYNDLQSNGRLRKVQKKEKPGLSNSTVRGIHMMLHNALDRAVKEKLILSNPTENCIIPKIEKQEMKILHPDHISAYLNAAERRNALPMFYLELVSGLRKGELVALQWSDLDEANCTISVSKQASWDTEGTSF